MPPGQPEVTRLNMAPLILSKRSGMSGWAGISAWQPKPAPYPIKPPMMDCGFVPGDQSLAPNGSQSEFGA